MKKREEKQAAAESYCTEEKQAATESLILANYSFLSNTDIIYSYRQ